APTPSCRRSISMRATTSASCTWRGATGRGRSRRPTRFSGRCRRTSTASCCGHEPTSWCATRPVRAAPTPASCATRPLSGPADAHLADRYALLAHGASVGDRYGPRVVARAPRPADPRAALAGLTVAVPGELTTAFLALRLYQPAARHVAVPFDRIEDHVLTG